MTFAFAPDSPTAVPLTLVAAQHCGATIAALPEPARQWAQVQGFAAGAGDVLVLPDGAGNITRALIGMGTDRARSRVRFAVSAAARKLPAGTYRLVDAPQGPALEEFALGWLLEGYHFDRYRTAKVDADRARARLVAPGGIDARRIEVIANAEALTRDLINTPPNDMGPAALASAAQALAARHGATLRVTAGDELLSANLPLIHTVGRAATAARAPRLIEMEWGAGGPALTLVGKGVCFDTGGLNIKPGASMGLMKKDMGGAATVLGLAAMIMGLDLPLRLRVLIPAVENAISAEAFRPQDILTARNGLTVEINNTDAEGRLVLADALALGAEASPDLMISMATLTGAARVAVGADIAPFFTDDAAAAEAIAAGGDAVRDPVWRMPLHPAYEAMIEPGIADLDNAPAGGMAGAITAALFLRRFAGEGRYVHFDIYGWQPAAAPARLKGGVGQGARALLAALPDLLGL